MLSSAFTIPAALLRRPRYSGRRSFEIGERLEPAAGRQSVCSIALDIFGSTCVADDWQEEQYRENHADELAVSQVDDGEGNPLLIDMAMRGRTVYARVWRADIGHVPLYLLDTNVPENEPVDRLVTGHLYGGDRETRLVQEMMLGIGGVRLLEKLGIDPAVFHLNEGHSAFLTLELTRLMIETEGRELCCGCESRARALRVHHAHAGGRRA